MGSSYSKAPGNTRVVIVGGGLAATEIAVKLQNYFQVTIIDRSATAYHPIGALRAVVQKDWEESLFAPRDRVLNKATLLTGDVTEVNSDLKTVAFKSAQGARVVVPYDILVLATGITYGGPATRISPDEASSKQGFRDMQAAAAAAHSILIIGGGPVGVELAGEIKEAYPDKTVTIVHSGEHLISAPANGAVSADPRLGAALAAKAATLGINVLLSQRAEGAGMDVAAARAAGLTVIAPGAYAGRSVVNTSAGARLDVDLQFWVNGGKPNTSFLKGSSIPLDRDGFISVEPSLQVVGQPSIFAIGDCAATTHGKTVLTVKFSHVGVIPNIHAAALNAASPASPVALKPIGAPGLTAMLVPIGSKHGAARIGPFHFGDRFARMKGADLFAPKFLAEHKYTLEELRPKKLAASS